MTWEYKNIINSYTFLTLKKKIELQQPSQGRKRNVYNFPRKQRWFLFSRTQLFFFYFISRSFPPFFFFHAVPIIVKNNFKTWKGVLIPRVHLQNNKAIQLNFSPNFHRSSPGGGYLDTQIFDIDNHYSHKIYIILNSLTWVNIDH